MKRFWLVLLSLGLIMAFSVSAYAVDVKFSGSMYAAGMHVNRTNLDDSGDGVTTSFYFQRLRMFADFVVAPGVTLKTRFDIMERVWGATRTAASTSLGTRSMGTTAENENIAFDRAYIQYDSPYGSFQVGARSAGTWGTIFGDSESPAWRIYYSSPVFAGGAQVLAAIQKSAENSFTASNAATAADRDYDVYLAAVTYTQKAWNTGLLYVYYLDARSRSAGTPYKSKYHLLQPYVKANIGPVALQAEIGYAFGKYADYEAAGTTTNEKADSLAGWIDATATFGPVYVGATFAYAQGDKDSTDDKKQDILTGGTDWSPTLIMYNEDRASWFGNMTSSYATAPFGSAMTNAYFYQVRAGVKPVEKLDVMASVSFAQADVTPANYVSKDFGYEIDVTGTYKITNNLSYMLGFGYLIAGDYFKGTSSANKVKNDYLVINKLTLTF